MPFLKQIEIVTDVDKLNVDIQETIMKYQTIKQWAYIIHDKDDTRPRRKLGRYQSRGGVVQNRRKLYQQGKRSPNGYV